MEGIKVGSQVVVRKFMGDVGNLIQIGEVISIQASKATVHISSDNVRREVPLNQLELSSKRFPGRSRVQINPLNRRGF